MTHHHHPVRTTWFTVILFVLFLIVPYGGMFVAIRTSNDARDDARHDAIEAKEQVVELQRQAACRSDISSRSSAALIAYVVALSQGGDVSGALAEVQSAKAASELAEQACSS